MKGRIPLACATCLLLVATASYADTPPPPQQKTPQQTKPATPSTTGAADKSVFQAGAKPDASAGCSTPTDARSAGVDEKSKESNARTRPKENRTVCTTAGAEGVGANDSKAKQRPKKNASAPSSTSEKPR